MSISSRITAIEEHIGNAYEKLEDLGIDLTNVDKNIDNIASKLEEIYNDYPKVTASNVEETSLSNTNKGRMEIDLKGNTSQESTTGKNLLPTETTVSFTQFKRINVSLPAGTYTISCKERNTSALASAISANDQIKGTFTTENKSITFTVTSEITSIGLYSAENYSASSNITCEYRSLMLEQGSTATSYEPYTGGEASPNPSYPQTIHNVSGNNTIKVQNKNLFSVDEFIAEARDKGYTTSQVSKTTYLDKEVLKYQNFLPNLKFMQGKFEENTRYILKTGVLKTGYNDGNAPYISIVYTDETEQSLYVDYSSTSFVTATATSRANKTIDYIRVPDYALGQIVYLDLSVTQLEQGSTATDYIAHAEQNLPIDLGEIELCKIGTAQDFPFKAVNGDDYYDSLTAEQKNALTYGRWYYHKEETEVIFDGSDDEGWVYNGAPLQTYAVTATLSDCYYLSSNTDNIARVLCNKMIAKSATDIIASPESYTIGIISNRRLYVLVPNAIINTVSAFKTFLSENPITVKYQIDTPTNTEITETTLINQLEAILTAKSYNEQTNVSQTNSDLSFILDIKALRGE